MPITLSGTRITVQYQTGDEKGNSFAAAYTLDDVVAASTAGGWNPAVTKTDLNYYTIPYSLYIQGASTYFSIAQNSTHFRDILYFNAASPNDVNMLYSADGAHIRIGINDSTSRYGVLITSAASLVSGSKNRIYLLGDVQIRNSVIGKSSYFYVYGDATYIAYAVNLQVYVTGFGIANNAYSYFDNVQVFGGSYGFQYTNFYFNNNLLTTGAVSAVLDSGGAPSNKTLQNLKIIDSVNYDTFVRLGSGTAGATKNNYFLDCEIDSAKMAFYASGIYTQYGYQYLQTSLNVEIRDVNGELLETTVNLYDKDNNLIFSETASGGTITNRATTYFIKYAKSEAGVITTTSTTDLQPLKMIINKSGYDDLEISNINIVKGVKTYIRATLIETTPPVYYHQEIEGLVSTAEVIAELNNAGVIGEITTATVTGLITTE